MTTTESVLVNRVKRKRDMAAFRDLVLEHRKRVYCLIRRIVQNHEDTEDLVQETFMKSLRFIDNIEDENRFGPWINSIAVNTALDFKRSKYQKGRISIDGDVPPEVISDKFVDTDESDRPLRSLEDEEIRQRVDEAVMKLPENHQKAFMLFHYNEMGAQEISDIMDCPVPTVRSYVFRAVRSLRKDLKEYYQSHKE